MTGISTPSHFRHRGASRNAPPEVRPAFSRSRCYRWITTTTTATALLCYSAFVLSTFGSFASAECYDNSTPFFIPTPRDENGVPMCGLGYHCPKFNPSDNTTYPQYCTPTPECIIERTFGGECDPMGDQEPTICPQGFYCPTATEVYECPEDHFCTYASYEPHECPPLAICPKGSHNFVYLGGVVATVVLLAAFAVMLAIYRLKLRFSTLNTNYADASRFLSSSAGRSPVYDTPRVAASIHHNMILTSNSTLASVVDKRILTSAPQNDFVTISSRQQAIEVLAGGFLCARSRTKPLSYDIRNLQVWAPGNKSSSRKGQLFGKAAAELAMTKQQRMEDEANAEHQPVTFSPERDDESDERDADEGRCSLFARPFRALRSCVRGPKNTNRVAILQGVTATFNPSTVTAILGPGGSGKSTLLNALLGRLPAGWTREGYVAVNGDDSADVLKRLRRVTGSATQAEPLHKELTVYQNLFYNAQARLPSEWTAEEKDIFLAATIEALQLVKQRDIPIGDEENRGVSGGQRRRCHIGIEIASAPYALFLDEPTNGLDATTALEVCSCLSAIATGADLTVVMTISQPRVEIWNALDNIIVIARGGRTVYQGSQQDAQLFFEQNYKVPFNSSSNPADIIVDAVAANGPALADLWEKHISDPNYFPPLVYENNSKKMSAAEGTIIVCDDAATTTIAHPLSPLPPNETACFPHRDHADNSATTTPRGAIPGAVSEPVTPALGPAHVQSHHHVIDGDGKRREPSHCVLGLDAHHESPHVTVRPDHSQDTPKAKKRVVIARHDAPMWRQVILFHNRAVAKQLSDLQPLIVEQIVNVVVALVLGFSCSGYIPYWTFKYYSLVSPPGSDLLPQIFMYCCMALGVVCVMPGSAVFVNARETYFREAGSGMSRLAYYIGTVLSLQSRIVLTALVFATLFQIVPQLTASFGGIFLFAWLVASCSYALGIIPAMIFSPASAPLVGALLVIFFGCLSGFIANFPLGLKYISYGFWASSIIQRYFQETVAHAYEDLATSVDWISDDVGLCVGVCIAMIVILHTFAFFLMIFVHRSKQR